MNEYIDVRSVNWQSARHYWIHREYQLWGVTISAVRLNLNESKLDNTLRAVTGYWAYYHRRKKAVFNVSFIYDHFLFLLYFFLHFLLVDDECQAL